MNCKKCGKKINDESRYCMNCGEKIEVAHENEPIKKTLKVKMYFLICLGIFFLLIFIFAVIGIVTEDTDYDDEKENKDRFEQVYNEHISNDVKTKTIMIYMAGTDLESDAYLGTSDIEEIDPDKVDIDNINVVLYTGGTRKWHNFVEADENATYILKNEGFVKVKETEPINMGDKKCFEDFLNFVYDNFKAESYNLIFWNHGLGSLGAILDEKYEDYLSTDEMREALENSKFKNDKIDTVTFETCLNGTFEIAMALSDYVDYLVASEEITFGKKGYSILSFINEIEEGDTPIQYSKKFINAYKKQVQEMVIVPLSTYSIIDLRKMDDLSNSLKEEFSKIDINKDYKKIAFIRKNIEQFGVETGGATDYDTVDLYSLIKIMQKYSLIDTDEIINILNECIVYNWTTSNYAHGLSIYFPYYGQTEYQKLHFEIYDKLNINDKYYKFIQNFSSKKSNAKSFNFKVYENEIIKNNKDFKLKLNEEQIENYANSEYVIFEKKEDNTYMPILISKDTYLDENGYVNTQLNNSLLKIYDNEGNYSYVQLNEVNYISNEKEYITNAVLFKFTEELEAKHAVIHIKIDNSGNPYIASVILNDKIANGIVVNIDDYDYIQFTNFRYHILNENGEYIENWESIADKYLFEVNIKEGYDLKLSNLDDEEYYCVFKVYDINNNYYYSDLISVE